MHDQIILKTKVRLPSNLHKHIPRRQLNQHLADCTQNRLTLVLAPAGFGKSSLVADWAAQQDDYAIAWLAVERADNDLYRFLTYLFATLQTVDPSIAQTSAAQLNHHLGIQTEILLTHLLNDISKQAQPTILVLDDYHLIDNDEIDQAIAYLVEHAPPNLRLIVTSREEPNFPLYRWRIDGLYTEIGINQLRFSQDETSAFLRQVMELDVADIQSAQLAERTEGWVAGLQIAALMLRNKLPTPNSTALVEALSGKHHYIIDYLAAEVLNQQTDSVRDFLIKTSVLDEFCVGLCNAVTERNDSRDLLSYLEKNHLFLVNLDKGRQWYRYHHLFSEFLQGFVTDEARQQMRQRASIWFESEGQLLEALQYALAAGDEARAEALLEQHILVVASDGKLGAIYSWLNALPPERIKSNGYFAAVLGWITYLRGDVMRARQLLTFAQQFAPPNQSPIYLATLYGFRAELANGYGAPAQAIVDARQCIQLLEQPQYEQASFFLATAYKLLGEARQMKGERQVATSDFRQAMRVARQRQHPLVTAKSTWHLALLLYFQGQSQEAASLCRRLRDEHCDEDGQALPLAGFGLIPLGVLAYESNQLDKAYQYLSEGLPLLEQVGMLRYALIGYHILAKIELLRGNQAEAIALLQKARQIADDMGHVEEASLLAAGTAELYLKLGNFVIAQRWLDSAESQIPAHSPLNPERLLLTKAYLLMRSNDVGGAETLLENLRLRATEEQRYGRLIRIHILQAIARCKQNDTTSAVRKLQAAIRWAAPEQFIRSFVDVGSDILPLLSQVQTDFPHFVEGLIAAISAETNTPQRDFVPIDLTEREIEIMQLVSQGASNRDISEQLHLTTGTVKWYLTRVYKKLGVKRRTSAVSILKRENLI